MGFGVWGRLSPQRLRSCLRSEKWSKVGNQTFQVSVLGRYVLFSLGMLLANQDTELTQDHSGRKAASRNSRGRCGGPPCVQKGMHGFLCVLLFFLVFVSDQCAPSRAQKERKKTETQEGWEDGTPPPHRDFKERGVMR